MKPLTLSSILIVVCYVLGFLLHAALAGNLGLPGNTLAILATVAIPLDYVLDYAIGGLKTGNWSPPAFPVVTSKQKPVTPPAPPTPIVPPPTS